MNLNLDLINKTGWLYKKGANRKNWKRRFFVLNGTELTYYPSEEVKNKQTNITTIKFLSTNQKNKQNKKIEHNKFFFFFIKIVFFLQLFDKKKN